MHLTDQKRRPYSPGVGREREGATEYGAHKQGS